MLCLYLSCDIEFDFKMAATSFKLNSGYDIPSVGLGKCLFYIGGVANETPP